MRADELLQIEYAKFAKDCPKQLSSEERERILALSNDLPALWHASTTSPEDRQSIGRLLLEEVIVSMEGNTDRMEVELRWAGGFISRHTLLRSVQTYKQLSNFDELVARIDVLRTAGNSLPEIASKLNEDGFRPNTIGPDRFLLPPRRFLTAV